MKKTIEAVSTGKCYGCGACENICAVGAIQMKTDAKGFLYPTIDSTICVLCGRCLSACPAFSSVEKEEGPISNRFFAVTNRDKEVRLSSKSGGVFFQLACDCIQRGGVVYGVVMDGTGAVFHKRFSSEEGLRHTQKSKYVQSTVGNAYAQAGKDLTEEREVIFSGTACQIEALQRYLACSGICSDRLICLDIVCHGVPSPEMFKSYLSYIEKKFKSPVSEYSFRDKTSNGWGKEDERLQLENGKTITSKMLFNVDFFYTVYKHELIRDRCFSCPYATPDRRSDITIGDFWGIDAVAPEMNDKLGTSLVITHSAKGQSLFERNLDSFVVKEVQREDCLQPNLREPSSKKPETEQYWSIYLKKGFEGLAKKDSPAFKTKVKATVKEWMGMDEKYR